MSDSSEAGHACHLSAQEQTASSPGHFLDGRGSGFETATRGGVRVQLRRCVCAGRM